MEVTEAVPQNIAHKSAIRETGAGPRIHFIEHAVPGEPKRRGSDLRKEIERDAPSEPWVGHAPEVQWAAAMLHFAKEKLAKASRPGFASHPRNWLLIYDNWPLPQVHMVEAAARFSRDCLDAKVFDGFDRLFVLGSTDLCELELEPAAQPTLHSRARWLA